MTELLEEARKAINSYLKMADKLAPGAIVSVAVGGSIALDAYRPGASDIDLIAVVDDSWRAKPSLIPRLRALHISQLPRLLGRAIRGKRFSACCNTSFVWESEISLPVTLIKPIASHVGEIFNSGGAFDVNPVIWDELLSGGIVVRGQALETWNLDGESPKLKSWTKNNLQKYWKSMMLELESGHGNISAAKVEWCVLGPARMYVTLLTGKVVSKEAGGRRVCKLLPDHAPIIEVALAHLLGGAPKADTSVNGEKNGQWRAQTVVFMREIISQSEHGTF